MGCCGCTNKTSVIVGGIFGLIQAAVGLIFNIYFLTLYFGFNDPSVWQTYGTDSVILLIATVDSISVIRGLLIAALVLHTAWFVSSIVVLVGNRSDNVPCLRQWLVFTSLIIIGDIVFAPILFGFTIFSVVKLDDHMNKDFREDRLTMSDASLTLWKYYIILLSTFCKLGLITIVTNICLAVFTGKRISEIVHPTTGYVLAPPPPGAVPVYPVLQPGYPMSPQNQPLQNLSSEPKNYNSKF